MVGDFRAFEQQATTEDETESPFDGEPRLAKIEQNPSRVEPAAMARFDGTIPFEIVDQESLGVPMREMQNTLDVLRKVGHFGPAEGNEREQLSEQLRKLAETYMKSEEMGKTPADRLDALIKATTKAAENASGNAMSWFSEVEDKQLVLQITNADGTKQLDRLSVMVIDIRSK